MEAEAPRDTPKNHRETDLLKEPEASAHQSKADMARKHTEHP